MRQEKFIFHLINYKDLRSHNMAFQIVSLDN